MKGRSKVKVLPVVSSGNPLVISGKSSTRSILDQKLRNAHVSEQVYLFLEDPSSSYGAKVFNYVMVISVFLSVLLIIMETMDGPNQYEGRINLAEYPYLLTAFGYDLAEIIITAIFFLEFGLRILSDQHLCGCHANNEEENGEGADGKLLLQQTTTFFKNPYNWIDLMCFLPTFVEWVFSPPFQATNLSSVMSKVMSSLKILKTLRIVKLVRRFSGSGILISALRQSMQPMLLPLFFFFVFTIMFGSFIFFLEPCYNRETCQFVDIFNGAYFAMVTMTTVGYGDQVPQGLMTRMLDVVVMMFGALFLAMPLTIIGNIFNDAWKIGNVQDNAAKEEEERVVIQTHQKHIAYALAAQLAENEQRMEKSISSNTANKIVKAVAKLCAKVAQFNSEQVSNDQASLNSSYIQASTLLHTVSCKFTENIPDDDDDRRLLKIVELYQALKDCHFALENMVLAIQFHTGYYMRAGGQVQSPHGSASNTITAGEAHITALETTIEVLRVKSTMKHAKASAVVHTINKKGGKRTTESSSSAGSSKEALRHMLHISKSRFLACSPIKKISNQYSQNYAFFAQIVDAQRSSHIFDRLWLAFEVPTSSKAAKYLQMFLVFCIASSVFVFALESVPEFQTYSESSYYCQNAVRLYCDDKYDRLLDPGCFVAQNQSITEDRLQFFCGENNCFGVGNNFGAIKFLTCSSDTLRPFQTQEQLGKNQLHTFASIRANQVHDICFRPECDNDHYLMFDASQFWLPLETFFALVFTAELVTRLIVARNKLQFCLDTMNWCDVAAVVPFYVDVVDSLVSGTPLDFTLGPTKPALLMFIRMAKVFRVFKLTRHFQGAAVLVETFHLAWKKLLVPILFFFLFTLIFGGLVFAVESGTECFVGEGSCSMLGYEDEFMYSNGTRLLIDPYGELANINDMNGAIWLTIVTMTSVGYGLITPSYMPGKFVMVFVMLFGTFYLAMPLIIIGGQFYVSYDRIHKTQKTVRAIGREFLSAEGSLPQEAGMEAEEGQQRVKHALGQLALVKDRLKDLVDAGGGCLHAIHRRSMGHGYGGKGEKYGGKSHHNKIEKVALGSSKGTGTTRAEGGEPHREGGEFQGFGAGRSLPVISSSQSQMASVVSEKLGTGLIVGNGAGHSEQEWLDDPEDSCFPTAQHRHQIKEVIGRFQDLHLELCSVISAATD